MHPYLGVSLALLALLGWGLGDFFIQKTTRLVGSWRALFWIGLFGAIVIFPFVIKDIAYLKTADLFLLGTLSVVVVLGSLFNFEALRQGKMAIVEPIISLELPLTIALSVVFLRESLELIPWILIALVFVGIILAITKHHTHWFYHRRALEKGVILASIGVVGTALSSFLIGVSSQNISPLITVWFVDVIIVLVCGFYMLYSKQFKELGKGLRKYRWSIISQSFFDNLGWVAFAVATTLIPISIAITISESYVALAVLLGFFINREKLQKHQLVGAALAIISVIVLAGVYR